MKWIARNNAKDFYSSETGRFDLIQADGYWVGIDWEKGRVVRGVCREDAASLLAISVLISH